MTKCLQSKSTRIVPCPCPNCVRVPVTQQDLSALREEIKDLKDAITYLQDGHDKLLADYSKEVEDLKRAVGILVEYAQARPHKGDDLGEDIENAKEFREASEWLSNFINNEHE